MTLQQLQTPLIYLHRKMLPFSHFLITFLSLALSLFLLQKWRHNQTPGRRKILPPSPRKLPVIGNLHQLGSLPHRSLQSLSRRYGPLMLLHLGRVPVLVVSSADLAREVMKNQDLIFSNRPELSIPKRLFYNAKDVAFSPYGEYWRQMRSVCVLQLLSLKRVQSFRRVREEVTSIMVEKIRRSGSSVVNLTGLLVSMTNDVVFRVALGRKHGTGEKGEKLKALFRDVGDLLAAFCAGEYIPWLAWVDRVNGLDDKIEKTAKGVDALLEMVVEVHRSGKIEEMEHSEVVSANFVDILLEFQRESKDDSSLVDNNAIKAMILDMFFAGTETTSTTLEWTMAELLRNPRAMETLQKEVREVAGSKREIEENDLEKMPYLKAVMKESLRLHPPAPLLLPREATQDTKILSYDVASGTHVMINAWAIARDPLLWENPNDFYPERFLGSNVDFRGLHFELIPFGAGRRGCPGIAFATAVNELALAKLVHSFNFELADGERAEDMDMSEGNGTSVHKKLPLLVIATSFAC